MTKITQPPKSTNNPVGNERIEVMEAEEEAVFKPQNELPFPTEVDLNEVFPEEDKDLNELFPDEETKLLLKKMIGLSRMTLALMTIAIFLGIWLDRF